MANTNLITAVNPACSLAANNDKGSIGNRIEHSVEQTKNSLKTQFKDQFVSMAGVAGSIGAAAAVSAAVSKSKTAQNFISKYISKVKNSNAVKNTIEELTPYIKKGADKFKALPTPAKVVLGIGLVLTTAASNLIRAKGIYDAGKIDQKYTDRAKLQQTL